MTEIDRLIRTAWHDKLPVYMELPSDIAYLDIEVPAAPLVLAEPPSDPERLRSRTAAIADRLSQAKSPALLVDLDADRVRGRRRDHEAGRTGPTRICRRCSGGTPRRARSSSRPWPIWRRPSARRTTP